MAKKKEKPKCVRCIDCAKAEIHQWANNPLIAFCCGNPEKRTVANTPSVCLIFEQKTFDHNIIHHQRGESIQPKQV